MNIKETKELLDFCELLSVKMVKALKDGLGVDDAKVLLDAELWASGKAAVGGMSQVPAEMKDLDFQEAAELAVKAIHMAEAISRAAKEPAVAVAAPAEAVVAEPSDAPIA